MSKVGHLDVLRLCKPSLLMETNINNRFDQFDSRFNHFERRMDHVEYDVHQLQAYHNISCTWPPPMPPSQGDDFDSAT